MSLHNDIRTYYLTHFDELPFDAQFHFANRLSAWSHDEECVKRIASMRPEFLGDDHEQTIKLRRIIESHPNSQINGASLRAPYFAQYPDLFGIHNALFRVRHALFLYNTDLRPDLLLLFPTDRIQELYRSLTADTKAVKYLSTYAINYLYLIDRILFPELQTTQLDPKVFVRIGQTYDTSEYEEIRLLIYLYTHCIIAETNFYAWDVPTEKITTYHTMLAELEVLIRNNILNTSLDTKLEFLTCAALCGYTTTLRTDIFRECEASVSPDGMFLIDRHNTFRNSPKKSLADSEHRNVLFIMATTERPSPPENLLEL